MFILVLAFAFRRPRARCFVRDAIGYRISYIVDISAPWQCSEIYCQM